MNGIYVEKGTGNDAKFMIITKTPLAIQPTTFAGAPAAGGSLVADTYYYVVTEMGYNGESKKSAEINVTTAGGNLTAALTWDLASGYSAFVSEYRVYRGTTSGVYDGFFRVTTNSFNDDGTFDMDISNTVPPTSNTITSLEKTRIRLDEICTISGLFVPEYSGDFFGNKRQAINRVELFSTDDKMLARIDIESVLYPTTWNTGTQAGNEVAKATIASWTI